MYVHKLDGRVDVAFFERISTETWSFGCTGALAPSGAPSRNVANAKSTGINPLSNRT